MNVGQRGAMGLVLLGALSALPSTADADATEIAGTVCAACHGEGGNSSVPMFPRLAGLQVQYLSKQLNDYLSGKRKNDIMTPVVASLKWSDLSDLAAYFAAQKPQPGIVQDKELAAVGKVLYEDGNTTSGVPACEGCHQPKGVGNARYPRIAGQHQAYTIAEMTQFKKGTRANDRAHAMRSVAERMTEQEIAAVAEYLAGL